MCEIVDPYGSRSERVKCAGSTKTTYDIGNRKRGNAFQEEGLYLGKLFERERGLTTNGEQVNAQITLTEITEKTKLEYLKLNLISYLQS